MKVSAKDAQVTVSPDTTVRMRSAARPPPRPTFAAEVPPRKRAPVRSATAAESAAGVLRWVMLVGVLGPVTVRIGAMDRHMRGQRQTDLLTVLLQRRGTSVPSEVLLDLVWGESPSAPGVAAVHTAVARLRRQFSDDLVETVATGYRLGSSVVTDEDDFVERVRRGRHATRTGDVEGAITLYRTGLALWRGAAAYEGADLSLVRADRARLEELRCSTAEDLAAALLDGSGPTDLVEALELAEALVREFPLRERPYALAMHAAYRSGRQVDALETYRTLRRRLRGELGIEPSPALSALHEDVLAHDPRLDRAVTQPSGPARPGSAPVTARHRRTARIAAPATPTVGRSGEVDDVLSSLTEGRRLVTIVGPGGVGKSRLLAEVGLVIADRGTPAAYLDLSSVGAVGVDELVDALAQSVGLPDPGSIALEALVASMRATDLVLLVDEAEWAPGAVATVVRAVLDGCPRVRFVVTSRVPLDTLGERRLLLGPLACPDEEANAASVAAAPAVRLLVARLTDQAPDLVLDDAAMAQMGAIARRVDGLPLALEIVAGYASSTTIADLLALVSAPLDVSATDRERPTRHRTLRETLVWSVDRLNADQQAVFRRLGVFVGPFDLAAAAAVVGPVGGETTGHEGPDGPEVPGIVRSLVREALVQVDREGPELRFRMLRTVRELALESLAADGSATATAARHRRWFAERWAGEQRSDELIEAVRSQYGDYVEALRSALEACDGASAADIVMALTRYWLFGSWNGPGLRWSTRTIDSGILTPLQRARVQVQRASLALALAPALARADAEEAAPVLAEADERDWLVTAHTASALERYASGDRDGALRSARASVAVARTTGPERLADALGVEALTLAASGEDEAARAVIAEASDLVRESGSVAARISVSSNLALALVDIGDFDRALRLLDEVGAAIPGLLGAPPDFFMLNLGWAALGAGDLDRAREAFTVGIGAGAAARADRHTAEGYAGLACVVAHERPEEGEQVIALAGELARRVGLALTPGQQGCVDSALAPLVGDGPDRRHSAVESTLGWSDTSLAAELHALLAARPPAGAG